jgi:GH15 family glucan-1,4-alpha-glucosidase
VLGTRSAEEDSTPRGRPSDLAEDAGDYTGSPKVLRDYAFIADGQRGAMIDSDGRLAWMCFPGWSDTAVFAGLLGALGEYQVAPVTRAVPGGHYEDGTLIWHSRWVTGDGFIDCREALAYPGEADRAVILRRISAVDAPARVVVALHLATDYGRRPLDGWRRQDNRWITADGVVSARLTGADEAVIERGPNGTERLVVRLDLDPGDHRDLILEVMTGAADRFSVLDASDMWARTEEAWRAAVPSCTDTIATGDVRRSFAVLRGMTGPDGATVAAATTSLPERSEAGRNYDYRYCWVRDICYIGHAGAAVKGGEAILDDAVRWVSERLLADGTATMPAYLPNGTPIPDERPLGLPGYPGGYDVIGNRVRSQFQLDLFGEALLLLANAASVDRLDADGWRAAELAIAAIEQSWHKPDNGVWETEPAPWTHSRLICVAGLRAIAGGRIPSHSAATALSLADLLLSEADRTSLHRSGRWQRAPDDERVDASLLLAEIRGALPSSDPRSRATRDAIVSDLVDGGFLYRYGHPGQDLGQAEGAFLICNFWMSLATTLSGDTTAGARWFERARAACGSPGIFAEEFDVEQRQLRGNFPQAFVHALLIEAAAAQDGNADDVRW